VSADDAPAARPLVAPYGEWKSPITAESLVSGAVGVGGLCVDGDDLWWSEARPDEAGRTAVMRLRDGRVDEMTPPDVYVRTLVHEYGGGAWTAANGVLYFVDLSDQRVHSLVEGHDPLALTPEPPSHRAHRHADLNASPDGRWLVAVRERHHDSGEPVNELVAVPTDGSSEVCVLWGGSDFVMAPRLSPDGTKLAWIAWNHPSMPWDVTELWIADFGDGRLSDPRKLVGNGAEAICEPGWAGDGRLMVCTDRGDWWNLHEVAIDTGDLTPILVGPFEIATPPWVFGMQRWAVSGDHVVAVAGMPAGDELIVDGHTTALVDTSITSVQPTADGIAYIGAGWGHESVVAKIRIDEHGHVERDVVATFRYLPLGADLVVEPTPINYRTEDGAVAHALWFPPTNPGYVAPAGELPPLLVLVHGGPTAQARRQIQLGTLYWTSRGIGVVDVDYRGSTGYGRRYRRALNGEWGVADVADCVAAARHLADVGHVDGDRLMIRGGSAGGFTVLSALAFHDVFAVGASRYGVADLAALATDTHKFESRYTDTLVGPWPDAREIYEARSPIRHIDGFDRPMIVLQGDEDRIVPPNQSEMIVAALEAKGVPVAYLLFQGEQHGFRSARNIIAALEAELVFFGAILGFEPLGPLPPVEIRR